MTRTRNSIPHHLTDPLAQVTDLCNIIEECLAPGFDKPTVRICSWDDGLVRVTDNKPYYLTEFQKGYMYALMTLPKNNLDGKYICKRHSYDTNEEMPILDRTDTMCSNCKPRIMATVNEYTTQLEKRVDETFIDNEDGEVPVM
jgi:hypothetical protein